MLLLKEEEEEEEIRSHRGQATSDCSHLFVLVRVPAGPG